MTKTRKPKTYTTIKCVNCGGAFQCELERVIVTYYCARCDYERAHQLDLFKERLCKTQA